MTRHRSGAALKLLAGCLLVAGCLPRAADVGPVTSDRIQPFGERTGDVEARRWRDAQAVDGGSAVNLAAPDAGHWVALLTRP